VGGGGGGVGVGGSGSPAQTFLPLGNQSLCFVARARGFPGRR